MRYWTYILDVSGIDWKDIKSIPKLISAVQSLVGEVTDERAVANLNVCIEEFNSVTSEEKYDAALNSLVDTCDSFSIWIKD